MAVEPKGTGTDLLGKYERALVGAKQLVGGVSADELSKPTPCEGWDVRALVTHMIGTNGRFASALSGGQAPPPPAADADLVAAYAASADNALQAWQAPGVFDKTLQLPAGTMPASTAIGAIFVDQLIHTWDLAKALDRGDALPDDLATAALASARGRMTPDRRGPGKPYGPEIPCAADAPAQDRLAAFLGRQP
jgi:uncharacterized protein (TIGR03086 family)